MLQQLLTQFLIALLVCVVASLVWAVFLRIAARWVLRREVPFGTAYLTVLLASLAGMLVTVPLTLLFGPTTPDNPAGAAAALLALPVVFLVEAAIIGRYLKVRLSEAALVTLVMFAIGAVLGLIFMGVVMAVIAAYR